MSPRLDGAVVAQARKGFVGLGDLHIAQIGRHAGRTGATSGAVAPGHDAAVGPKGGEGGLVDALTAAATSRDGRVLAGALVGGVAAHLDGEGLRCNAIAVAGGQGELVGAGGGGGTGHCAVGLQRHAGGQGAGDPRILQLPSWNRRNRAQVVAGRFADGVVGVADRFGRAERGRGSGDAFTHHRE